jgi:hypothetical protein
MKKALLIKLEAPSYSSIGMEAAFKEHYEVRSIDWQRVRFNGGLDGLNILWKLIEQECVSFMPDIIFCQFQKSEVLSIENWKRLSEFGFVINYTEDVREDISWYEEVAPHIGLTIFTNEDDVNRFKCGNVGYMLVSYNHLWYKPQPKTKTEYGDIIFVGNNYVASNLNFPFAKERQEMIEFMKRGFGDKFQAYGMGQENQMLSPAQVVEAYNNAKVVITQSNFKRKGYMSDRGCNSIGCGAITIHQHFEGIERMFSELPYYNSWKTFEGLEDACNFYLKEFEYPYNYKKEISDYAVTHHSWKNRIKFVIGMVKFKEQERLIKSN